MAKKQKGPKIIKQNFFLYNIVIQPVDRQTPEAYIDLFKKIFSLQLTIRLSSNSYLRMMSLNHYDNGPLSGNFVKYQDLDEDKWYNSETNTIEQVKVDKNLHPNGKEIGFIFYPDKHRLVVESYLTTTQVKLFFEKVLGLTTEGTGMDVVFNVVKTEESISKIASNKHLTKLEICIYYTNSDNPEGWERLMDEENKESNVTKLILTATGKPEKPIDVQKNTMLTTALNLSRENGYVRAVEQTAKGKKTISSEQNPEVLRVKYPEGESIIQRLRNLLFGGTN